MNTKTFFDVQNIPMRLALVVVVCASFILTFYYTDDLLYAVIAAMLIFVCGFMLFLSIAKAKEKKALRLQQEEIDRVKQEQITKAQQLLEKVQNSEKSEWADVMFVMDTLSLEEMHKAVLLLKVNFIELFEISTIKEQFKWKTITGPLGRINDAMGRTYNDSIIQSLIDQIKEMEQYCHYKGYEALYKEVSKYDMIRTLVKLKTPSKKELAR